MGPAQEKLEAEGHEAICQRIEHGATQARLCEDFQVGAGPLSSFLHRTPERSARVRAAMLLSAEAWMDRGLEALEAAAPEAAEINRARAIEQHCARRAAIRNPKFAERTTLAGDPENPLIPAIDLSKATAEQLRALATLKLGGDQ